VVHDRHTIELKACEMERKKNEEEEKLKIYGVDLRKDEVKWMKKGMLLRHDQESGWQMTKKVAWIDSKGY
jgi:hypothetical protein